MAIQNNKVNDRLCWHNFLVFFSMSPGKRRCVSYTGHCRIFHCCLCFTEFAPKQRRYAKTAYKFVAGENLKEEII